MPTRCSSAICALTAWRLCARPWIRSGPASAPIRRRISSSSPNRPASVWSSDPRAGGRHAVEALREAADILGHAAVDVLGDLLGQALDLQRDLLDRRRDGGEVGPRTWARSTPLASEITASSSATMSWLWRAGPPPRAGARSRRWSSARAPTGASDLLDPRLEAAGEVHAHAGDDAAIGAGERRGRRQLALPLADILDRVADIGGAGRARRPGCGWRRPARRAATSGARCRRAARSPPAPAPP